MGLGSPYIWKHSCATILKEKKNDSENFSKFQESLNLW